MKLYLTVEGHNTLRRSFLNLKLFSVISVPDIISDLGYSPSIIDEYGAFIISARIQSLMKCYSKSKRIRGIIYSNPNLSQGILPSLFDVASEYETINSIVLLDDYNIPRVKHLYDFFDEIIFFPSIKKIRLIECNEIKESFNVNISAKPIK
jgi:hypothetical protein